MPQLVYNSLHEIHLSAVVACACVHTRVAFGLFFLCCLRLWHSHSGGSFPTLSSMFSACQGSSLLRLFSLLETDDALFCGPDSACLFEIWLIPESWTVAYWAVLSSTVYHNSKVILLTPHCVFEARKLLKGLFVSIAVSWILFSQAFSIGKWCFSDNMNE